MDRIEKVGGSEAVYALISIVKEDRRLWDRMYCNYVTHFDVKMQQFGKIAKRLNLPSVDGEAVVNAWRELCEKYRRRLYDGKRRNGNTAWPYFDAMDFLRKQYEQSRWSRLSTNSQTSKTPVSASSTVQSNVAQFVNTILNAHAVAEAEASFAYSAAKNENFQNTPTSSHSSSGEKKPDTVLLNVSLAAEMSTISDAPNKANGENSTDRTPYQNVLTNQPDLDSGKNSGDSSKSSTSGSSRGDIIESVASFAEQMSGDHIVVSRATPEVQREVFPSDLTRKRHRRGNRLRPGNFSLCENSQTITTQMSPSTVTARNSFSASGFLLSANNPNAVLMSAPSIETPNISDTRNNATGEQNVAGTPYQSVLVGQPNLSNGKNGESSISSISDGMGKVISEPVASFAEQSSDGRSTVDSAVSEPQHVLLSSGVSRRRCRRGNRLKQGNFSHTENSQTITSQLSPHTTGAGCTSTSGFALSSNNGIACTGFENAVNMPVQPQPSTVANDSSKWDNVGRVWVDMMKMIRSPQLALAAHKFITNSLFTILENDQQLASLDPKTTKVRILDSSPRIEISAEPSSESEEVLRIKNAFLG